MSDLTQLAGDHAMLLAIAGLMVAWLTREVLPVYYKAKEKANQPVQPVAAPPVVMDVSDPLNDTGKHAAIMVSDSTTGDQLDELITMLRHQRDQKPATQKDVTDLSQTITGVTSSVKTLSGKVTSLTATVNGFHDALDEHKADDAAHAPTPLEN